jgi:CheY-like chemotaxis protein
LDLAVKASIHWNCEDIVVSIGSDDTHTDDKIDRRVSVRRKEDFFWLKRLADLTGEACIVVNRHLGIEYVDKKIFDLLKIAPISQENLTQLGQLTSVMAKQGYFGQGDPKVFEALISDLLVNQRLKQNTATQIISAVTPSGQHIDIRVSLGRDDSYLLLMRDVTQEELKKRALDTALQVGQSGYWLYNPRTKDIHVRAESLRQHFSAESFETIENEGFLDVIHPDDRVMGQDAIMQVIKTRAPYIMTLRIVGDDKTVHWLKSHVMPNIDEGGKVRSLICFFTDITPQMRIEQDLRDAQTITEDALKAKNEFLGRLSHEVRTPLNAVIGMADALVHNCKDDTIRPQLLLIQNSAEKVMEMVDGTLEHTKLADDAVELNLRECSPRELVTTVCRKWVDKAALENTQLSFAIHPDVPKTMVLDDYRFEQCLSNLLSNAIKFTPGGAVKVILAPKGDGDNKRLVLAVRDNGIGMTTDSLEHIFQPFRQANKSISGRFGGTGLGLSIVKDLVDLMGGRINVTSEFGKGTLFAITFPIVSSEAAPILAGPTTYDIPTRIEKTVLSKPDAAPSLATPAPVRAKVQTSNETPKNTQSNSLIDKVLDRGNSPENPHSNLRVLIVDDNATNHIVVSSLLSHVVGKITTALNGQEALDQLKLKTFDLVLMDIHMPVMDGIETTLAIRSEPSSYQHVPIIALTADPQYQQARLCRNIGMNASLGKPIKLAALLQAFDEVLLGDDRKVASAA